MVLVMVSVMLPFLLIKQDDGKNDNKYCVIKW